MQNDPELAQAIQGSDLDNLQRILRERHQQKLLLRNKQEEELVMDPFFIILGSANSFDFAPFIICYAFAFM